MNLSAKASHGSAAIDRLNPIDALSAMLESHLAAVRSASDALPSIGDAARLVADALAAGATLHYAAAGSSGLMGLADACELPGTFGVRQDQVRISMAGGVPANGHMPGNMEDGVAEALSAAEPLRPGDVAIVISASGTTPYAVEFAKAARSRGSRVIAIANVEGSALLQGADIAITLKTAPEVLDGSTRLGAGTVQKVVLNMISTQAGVLLGHVHDGMMVNLVPDNAKLRKRAAAIVSRITGIADSEADHALRQSGFNTKLAILVASGIDIEKARRLLRAHDGHLRACLQNDEARNEKTS